MKKIIYGLLITVAIASGCDKQDSIPTRFTTVAANNANIKFLVMSPDAPAVNFLADGAKVTSVTPTATNAVVGLTFASLYPATVGYSSINSGALKFEAKVPDSSLVLPGRTLFSNSLTLTANKFYTYVLVDSVTKLSAVLVEDDPNLADPTKAYFRVANFISNGAVKIEIVKTSTGNPYSTTFNSLAFKTVSAFDSIGAGAGQTYRVFLRDPISNLKLDSIAGLVPTNTKKYTIYCRGVLGQTGSTNAKRPIITNYINF